jgi:death-on-curing protein
MYRPNFLFYEVIDLLHATALAEYGGPEGIRDEDVLYASIDRAENKFYYSDDAPDLFDLAAAYAFSFARNHPFVDGNKRTAWASCVSFLNINGVGISVPDEEKESQVMMLANSEIDEIAFANWLRRNQLA